MIQTQPFKVTDKEYRDALFLSAPTRFPLVLSLIVGIGSIPLGLITGWIVFTVLGSLMLVLLLLRVGIVFLATKLAMRLPLYKKDWTVTFGDDRVVADLESGTSTTLHYTDVVQVQVLPAMILLCIGKRQYHVVPKRAFVNESEFLDAIELMRRYGRPILDRS